MYKNAKELYDICVERNVPVWLPIIENECMLKEITENEIVEIFSKRLDIMYKSTRKALDKPLDTTGKLITGMSQRHWKYAQTSKTLCGSMINKVMAYSLSTIEVNASMGLICAAPTAGSAGILPAVLFGIKENFDVSDDELLHALITASGFGAIVTANATVAGAEGGCQAECGTAAAISAAAAVQLMNGTVDMIFNAFSIAFVNIMGLICDPIAGLVQIPCAQRNASQSINALLSADLALGGMTLPVSADEVIEAMMKVGESMPSALRETAIGGIAGCNSSCNISKSIFK